jgi:hypothetical protein
MKNTSQKENPTMIEEPTNALAPTHTVEAGMLIGQAQDLFSTALMAMWTSIDPAKKALILRASGDADTNLIAWFDKNPGQSIDVVDVLVHNVQLASDDADETGEVMYTTQARTVLIDKAGVTYSSVSQGVLGSLQKIIALYGPPTWPDGLKITARRVKTRKFTTINLLVID